MESFYESIADLVTGIDPDNTGQILFQIYGYTIADMVIAFFCLKIATLFRQKLSTDIVICYGLLVMTVAVTPAFLLFVNSPYQLAMISLGTAGIHYAIIIYLLFSIRKPLNRILARLADLKEE